MTEAQMETAKAIRQVLGDPNIQIRPDQCLDDLGLDSLDRVELVILIESDLGVDFTDNEIEALHSVGDVIKLIEATMAAKEPA